MDSRWWLNVWPHKPNCLVLETCSGKAARMARADDPWSRLQWRGRLLAVSLFLAPSLAFIDEPRVNRDELRNHFQGSRIRCMHERRILHLQRFESGAFGGLSAGLKMSRCQRHEDATRMWRPFCGVSIIWVRRGADPIQVADA